MARLFESLTVVVRTFNEAKVWRSIGLMWRNKSARQAEFKALGELIKRVLNPG